MIDPDNPPWRGEKMGPPIVRYGNNHPTTPGKIVTTLKLDAKTLEFFRSLGTRPTRKKKTRGESSQRKSTSHATRRR